MMLLLTHTHPLMFIRIDVDFSPTGQTFAACSYDRTIRLYSTFKPGSLDVYHLRRMGRVFSILYSMDDKYVYSGSDDGNVRKWKSVAWRKEAVNGREERAMQEKERLKRVYANVPEVKRILKYVNSIYSPCTEMDVANMVCHG